MNIFEQLTQRNSTPFEESPLVKWLSKSVGGLLGAKPLDKQQIQQHNEQAGNNLDSIHSLLGINQPARERQSNTPPMQSNQPPAYTNPIVGARDPMAGVRSGATVYAPAENLFMPTRERPGNGFGY